MAAGFLLLASREKLGIGCQPATSSIRPELMAEGSRVEASGQQREARGLTAMNFKPLKQKFDKTYEDYLRSSGAAPKLNNPSDAMIAAEPFHGCKRAISSSSFSILTNSSNSPASHIFSSNRQSVHNFWP